MAVCHALTSGPLEPIRMVEGMKKLLGWVPQTLRRWIRRMRRAPQSNRCAGAHEPW
jgi:hypothetical protein